MEVGRLDMDRGVKMTLSQAHIGIQKRDFGGGGGVPSELDRIAAVEAFKELGVGTMRPRKENVIDNMQPEARFFKSTVKEILFKETHEQVSIGRGNTCTHGGSLNLQIMAGVGEIVVG